MEDILKSITEAEAKAAEIKAEALQKAAEIAASAEALCGAIAEDGEKALKLFREVQLKKAEEDAQKLFDRTIAEKTAEAKAYADKLAGKTADRVSEIVRRVSGGNC